MELAISNLAWPLLFIFLVQPLLLKKELILLLQCCRLTCTSDGVRRKGRFQNAGVRPDSRDRSL